MRPSVLIACGSDRSLGYVIGEEKMLIMQMKLPVSAFIWHKAKGE